MTTPQDNQGTEREYLEGKYDAPRFTDCAHCGGAHNESDCPEVAPDPAPEASGPGEHETSQQASPPPLLELREILEMAFMGHWIKDEQGNFVQINDKHYVLRDGLKYQIKALLNSKLIEARIDEVDGFDTRRHYGKDYQASLDELDEYKDKRLAELKAQQGDQS